ncbi:Hypothetical protein R9X50_00473600 [Acrodontium crateriforme]|uniref:Uncharacterized protein n=1 Tax=Acrodontium crateriforme TaxID=150365 RepID=A0AAQ3M6L4_9PEZI|nr:Hypothetical protein R9X50_00473600 [Acrodontium crateriforme]
MSTIQELANPFHAYIFGTSFWYFLRGIMRIIDPETVIAWFRPPSQAFMTANDLEIYTTWTDGFGLLTLSMLLLALADTLPLPGQLRGSSLSSAGSSETKRPFARAAVLITMFHHVTTGIGAYQHWVKPSHRTVAMDIGVYGNIGLTVLGVVALMTSLKDEDEVVVKKRGKKA